MSRHIPSFFTADFDSDPVSGMPSTPRASKAHREILYALNRGLPHGIPTPVSRTLSVLPGTQTPSGARTFTVHFHS